VKTAAEVYTHLCLRYRSAPLVSCDDFIQQASVEIEEGVDKVERGGGDKESAIMPDEVQAGLHQPFTEVTDQLLLLLKQLAEVVPPSLLHCIRH